MKTILLILLTSSIAFSQGCNELDILLLGDMSESVQGYEQFIADAFLQFANQELGKKRIGVITFNSDPIILHKLTENRTSLIKEILTIKSTPAINTTDLTGAFYKCVEEFGKTGRKDVKKIIILVSDGLPDDATTAKIVATQLKMTGIDIYCIMINASSVNKEYMESLGTEYFDTDYEGLSEKLRSINFCL